MLKMKLYSAIYDVYVWIMSHCFPISPGQLWQSKELGTIIAVTAVGKYYVSFTIWKMQSRRRIYGATRAKFRREYFLLLRH